ncbi:MAG: glutamate ABC transporter substrate-binding protein [Acidimicrobiia bacterium]
MKHSLRLWYALLAAFALVVTGCGGGDEDAAPEPDVQETTEFPAGSTMARLADAGVIKIGTKFDQPGLGNINLETDKPEGFDVEVGKIIAGKLGIEPDKIEWVETVSANRESFIANGNVDMVIATYTINDKRKEQIDFAGPYYVAGQDLLVAKDDGSVTGPETLAGKRVCAATGSTPIGNIRTNYPDAEPVEFDTYTECVDQLEAGQIDAVSTDDIILAGYASDPKYEGKFKVVGKAFSMEPYGIGLKKGDTAFRNFLNDTLEEIYADGSWKEAFDATLGKSGVEAPAPPAVNRY